MFACRYFIEYPAQEKDGKTWKDRFLA